MKKVLLPIVLLLAMASPAKVQADCGQLANDYLAYKKVDADSARNAQEFGDGAHYLGYVWGYISGDAGRDYAVPRGVNAGQAAHVVGRFIRDNPQLWHLQNWDCVDRALISTWPKK